MPLPTLAPDGVLPPGIHPATVDEVLARFGSGTAQREAVTARLLWAYRAALSTGHLLRFVIFGSYVTAKAAPNDVDIVLVMDDNLDTAACEDGALRVLDHERADRELGASVFWVRPSHLPPGGMDDFLAQWQVDREGALYGIVEVLSP